MLTRRPALFVVTALALLTCYWSVLRGMAEQWATDEDMGHGFVVPFVIAWVVWRERERLRNLPVRPCAWGFVLLLMAAGIHYTSVLGATGLFTGAVALLLSVAGAILCLAGFAWLRTWTFPLLLSLFMLPKLAVVYDQSTLPLQLLASRLAAALLTSAGVGVIRSGNILDVGGHQVAVAEACSGIRYLLPLGFVAAVFAYMSDSKPWMRVALLGCAFPIAIAANAVRVAFAAYSPSLTEGMPHAILGWFIFVLCLAALVPLRSLLNAVHRGSHA
jgi:exosortase